MIGRGEHYLISHIFPDDFQKPLYYPADTGNQIHKRNLHGSLIHAPKVCSSWQTTTTAGPVLTRQGRRGLPTSLSRFLASSEPNATKEEFSGVHPKSEGGHIKGSAQWSTCWGDLKTELNSAVMFKGQRNSLLGISGKTLLVG